MAKCSDTLIKKLEINAVWFVLKKKNSKLLSGSFKNLFFYLFMGTKQINFEFRSKFERKKNRK